MIDREMQSVDEIERIKEIKELQYYFEAFNALVIFLLIISNTALIIYLNRKENVMAEKLGKDSSVYQSEKIKLLIIALLFVLSYVSDLMYA